MKGFFLRVTGKKPHGNLYYRFSREGVSMTIWTGISVEVKKWDAAIQSPNKWSEYTSEERFIDDDGKECYRATDGSRVKRLMDDVVACVNKMIKDGKTNDDKQEFQIAIDNIVNREAYEHKKEAELDNLNHIRAFYDYFVDGIESGLIKHHDGLCYAPNSIRVWKGFKPVLHGAVDEHMTFEAIDKFFVDKFYLYLEKQGYFGTTMNHKISQMRKLCALASEYGKNNNAYSVSAWKKRRVEKTDKRTNIYMTDEEIDALYNMELEGKRAIVRDMFFLGCMTCQRYSDFTRINKMCFRKNDDGIPVISLTQKKTGTYVEIPIVDDRIMEVCERNNYRFPKMSSVTFNDNLQKLMCELAKNVPSLNEKYVTKLTKVELRAERHYEELYAKRQRKERMTDSEYASFSWFMRYRCVLDGVHLWERDEQGNVLKPKYAMVTSHTARRSGITNLYNTGLFDTRELRAMSGHKTDENLDLYIKTSISEQATKIYDKLNKLRNERRAKEDAQVVRMEKRA